MGKRTLITNARAGGGRKKVARRNLRLEWVEAGSLDDNPRNWRRHPAGQMAALGDVLGDPEVGWAGALLYNEKTKRLIDGHARKRAVDPKTPVPVLVGSWTEAGERKILATLDPLAAMAEADGPRLEELLANVDLSALSLEELAAGLRKLTAVDAGPKRSEAGDAEPQLAGLEYRIVIDCRDEVHQAELLGRFEHEGLTCRALMS